MSQSHSDEDSAGGTTGPEKADVDPVPMAEPVGAPPVESREAGLAEAEPGESGQGQAGVAGMLSRVVGGRIAFVVAGVVLIAMAGGLVGGFAGGWTYQWGRQRVLQDRNVTLPSADRGDLSRPSGSVAGIARRVLPSVVAVKVTGNHEEGTGSGCIIDRAGYILTNNHVVEAAANGGKVTIIYSNGNQAGARIVGRDSSYDLAVVKADTGDRVALQLGNSENVVVGDSVLAIGAPLGLRGTVTSGIVSALNRPVAAGGGQTQAFINAIQTDAAINPGNSGGPLVNSIGQVIGITSAIARVPGGVGAGVGSIGVGFAIPSDQARRTAEQLIRTGHSEHPVIGVLLDRSYSGQGVKVSAEAVDGQPPVASGGPADRAGIEPGDLITAFNGRPVTDPDELVVAIRARTPGDVVRLTIRRGSAEREVRVTLQASSE
jgi:putative serine protease PepD